MNQHDSAPEISVLMTVYNTETYLEEAIRSVLAQATARRWELLIVDDGSTDASAAVAARFADMHPRCIRLLRHAQGENRGISASRNLALEHARAPLIAFLDSDDVWLPAHLETLTAALESSPEAAMVYAGAERWVRFEAPFDEIAARAATWGENYLPPLFPDGRRNGGKEVRCLQRGQLLQWFQADESLTPCICSVLVRAQAARTVGGFCEAFRGLYDDQAFHAKVSLRFPIVALDACVARYRQHDRSCCARARVDDAERGRERQRFEEFVKRESTSTHQ